MRKQKMRLLGFVLSKVEYFLHWNIANKKVHLYNIFYIYRNIYRVKNSLTLSLFLVSRSLPVPFARFSYTCEPYHICTSYISYIYTILWIYLYTMVALIKSWSHILLHSITDWHYSIMKFYLIRTKIVILTKNVCGKKRYFVTNINVSIHINNYIYLSIPEE